MDFLPNVFGIDSVRSRSSYLPVPSCCVCMHGLLCASHDLLSPLVVSAAS